jgi:hypothetical protein
MVGAGYVKVSESTELIVNPVQVFRMAPGGAFLQLI